MRRKASDKSGRRTAEGRAAGAEGGYFTMSNASRSAKAIFGGSSGGGTVGGFLEVGVGRSFFVSGHVRRFQRTGERVFVADTSSPVYRLGHPLTIREVEAFEPDNDPDAFSRVVDHLLQSPHYGERWGRHWLDVARYADSTGADEDHRYPHAWRYRDYVIKALNEDRPYDQFVREQLAGDEANPGIQGLMQRRQEPRTGTGLNGFEPTISVDDLDAVIAAVEIHGGRITVPKAGIPTVGTLVRFEDTEGNEVGAMKYETPPRQ